MNTSQFTELRKKVGMTQSDVASALGLNVRTIASWEAADPKRTLTQIEARVISELFQQRLLDSQVGERPPLKEMCQQAFDAIPSEVVALWLVHERDCILMSYASYLAPKLHDKLIPSHTSISPLIIESLTTYPLRSGEILNLAGDAILHHKAKRFKQSRVGQFFKDGICESLLHVPAFTPSAHGPLPVLLLSFENKLDRESNVIVPKPGETTRYTKEDEETAKALAQNFRDLLLPDMRLLEMIE